MALALVRRLSPRRLTSRRLALAVYCILLLNQTVHSVGPAFSGADGAGAQATGGAGGVVYHVTKLDRNFSDTGIGTLRYGINDANFRDAQSNVIPRTIVFDVGGTVWLGRYADHTQGWDTQSPMSLGSHVTLAGETAPGGITIAGGGLKVNGTNAIVRNIRIAPGYGQRTLSSITGNADSYVYDGINVQANRVIVDHVTTLYATDEGISANENANNATVQYSIIANGQNYAQADAESPGKFTGHALGSLWQPGSNAQTSLLHNLYANEAGRAPRFGTEASKLTVPGVGPSNDFRNNVVYNWLGTAGSGAAGQLSKNNFESNYFLAGPGGETQTVVTGTSTTPPTGTVTTVNTPGGTSIFNGNNATGTQLYHSGNVKDINKNGVAEFSTSLTNADFGSSAFTASAFAVPYLGVTDSAANAYSRVLAYSGSNWASRDAITSAIIGGVANGTGTIQAYNDSTHGTAAQQADWNSILAQRSALNSTLSTGQQGAGGLGGQTRGANYDTDADGLPNVWEVAHGLNPAVADNNGTAFRNGYTNLQMFLNEVGAFPAPTAITFNNANGTGRYAEIGNWSTGVFQPSRFDDARIDSGVVKIDVVGQHAGTLKIATGIGSQSTVNFESGWLNVANDLIVGDNGTGTVNQSGGTLFAGTNIVIGGTPMSSFNLSGGVLATPLLSKAAGGGSFVFTGGLLHTSRVAFSMENRGGTLAPGSDPLLNAILDAGMTDLSGSAAVPGSPFGNTHINGNLEFQSGILEIEIGSLSLFDSISVASQWSLGGLLDVHFQNGFVPSPNDEWLIGTASSIVGQFDSIAPGFSYRVSAGALFLTAVPEPASILLVCFGSLAAIAVRRKRFR